MAIKKDLVNLNVKIPMVLKRKIDKHVTDSDHVNTSEFTRDALREAGQRSIIHSSEIASRLPQSRVQK